MYIVDLEKRSYAGGYLLEKRSKTYIAHSKRGLIKLLNAHRVRNSGWVYHYRFIRPVHVYKRTEYIDLDEIKKDINSFLVNVDFEEVEHFFEEDYAHLNIDFTMVVDADGCRAVMSFDEDGERESVVITNFPKVYHGQKSLEQRSQDFLLLDHDGVKVTQNSKNIEITMEPHSEAMFKNSLGEEEFSMDIEIVKLEEEEMSKKKKGNKDKKKMNVSREKVGDNTYKGIDSGELRVTKDANRLKIPENKVVLNGVEVAEKADVEDLHAEIDCLRTELASLEAQNVGLEAVIDALVEDVAELNKAQVENEKKEKQLGHEEVINALVDDVERLYQKVLDMGKEKDTEFAKRIKDEMRKFH